MAIGFDQLNVPSGDFLSREEKERMWENQQSFFITGGEPKSPSNFPGDGPDFQTLFHVIVKDPETKEQQDRILAFGHTRGRENLCIAAVQAGDSIGPCYFHKGVASPGKNAPWMIKGEKDPTAKATAAKSGTGADVPWDD
jgi:hypothetical protein